MEKTNLRIHLWGEKALRKKCKPVKEVTDDIRQLLDDMYLLMKTTDGIGLAANQAGMDISLIVIEFEERVFKLINPKVVKKKGSIKFEEGCLSFPDIILKIKRSEKVWVSGLDEWGNPFDIETEGVLAVILQHEVDHVNGIVFIDRIPFWKRIKLKDKLREIKKRIRQ